MVAITRYSLGMWCSNNNLCEQDTTSCHAECQWSFDAYLSFLRGKEGLDSVANAVLHIDFLLSAVVYSGGIDISILIGNIISKVNCFAMGVDSPFGNIENIYNLSRSETLK
jgi:hypothetical protein